MSDYLDISTSLKTNSLTLFVGTGFSKYMTNGVAPSWLELLVVCAKYIDKVKFYCISQHQDFFLVLLPY